MANLKIENTANQRDLEDYMFFNSANPYGICKEAQDMIIIKAKEYISEYGRILAVVFTDEEIDIKIEKALIELRKRLHDLSVAYYKLEN